jgi:hypothetical protein
MLRGRFDGVHGVCACESHQVGRRERSHVFRRPGPDPDALVAEEPAIDEDAIDVGQGKGGNRACRKARSPHYFVGRGDPRLPAACCMPHFRDIGPPVARRQNDHETGIAGEDDRFDDLAELATDRTSGVNGGRRALRKLFDAGLNRIPPQELGHPLDRFRPRGHGRSVIGRNLSAASPVLSTALMTTEINRIARTESLFREVNERIAETAENLGSEDAVFVCECADAGCDERLPAELDEYQQVRVDGVRFLVAPGHEEAEYERVMYRNREFQVVEKNKNRRLAQSVEELDPRSDEPWPEDQASEMK